MSRYLTGLIFVAVMLTFYHQAQPQSFQSSNLPIIIINTNGQSIPDEPKITADMDIINNAPGVRNSITDVPTEYHGKIGIELRGSSSRVLFPKKQFAVELRAADGSDIAKSLLGFPEEEDWILSAPYNDKSLMRDVLAYKLARDLKRYAPRTRFCEVVLNGNYQGVYFLNEKIKRDKNRVDISALNPDEIAGEDLTGGYIIKLDKTDGSSGPGFTSEFPAAGVPNKKIVFQYEYPKWDEIVPQQKTYIANFVSAFENTLASDDFANEQSGYSKFIDVDSFVDFLIMNEFTKNVDGYRLSAFFYKQKDSQGGKMFAGPIWDFNLGFGNANYCTGGVSTGFVFSEFNKVCPDDTWLVPFWWEQLMRDGNFGNKVAARWAALRSDKFATTRIHAYIDSVASVLNMESQQRNFQTWPVLNTYVWPNYYVGSSFQTEVDWLKNWISERAVWLDQNFPQLVMSANDYPGLASVNVFPNPSKSSFMVRLTNSKSAVINVLNTAGVLVERVELHEGQDGGYGASFGMGLPQGFYFYKVVAGTNTISAGKIVKH